jgi:hypothetical protein
VPHTRPNPAQAKLGPDRSAYVAVPLCPHRALGPSLEGLKASGGRGLEAEARPVAFFLDGRPVYGPAGRAIAGLA